MPVETDGRTKSLHGVTVHFQSYISTGLCGIAVRIGQIQVGDGTDTVQRILGFGAHELRPFKILALRGGAGDFHFKLRRGQRRAGQLTACVQNDLIDMRPEIEHFGDGCKVPAGFCVRERIVSVFFRFFVVF